MISKIRHWLIRLLARGDSIVLNVHFTSPCNIIFKSELRGMVRNNLFTVKDGKELSVITLTPDKKTEYHCLFDSRADLNK